MASFRNINIMDCLNGNLSVGNQCECHKECFDGTRCYISYNVIDLSFPSAILQDHPSTHIVYIILITILALIGFISNIFALITVFRERIRITVCGLYLIFFTICSFLDMCFFQTLVITVARYDSITYHLWACNIIPYVSLTLGITAMWLSVAISIEKVLIECFNFDIYGSRLRAIAFSIGFVTLSAVSNLGEIFVRHYVPDRSGYPICIYDYTSNPTWDKFNTVFSYINVIVPISLHLICTVCILTTIVKRKILIKSMNRSCRNICYVWFQQLYVHRDFFIPPLCIMFFVFPNTIFGNLLNLCILHTDVTKLRLHIAFIFMLPGPLILTFMIYIYPNEIYMKEFRKTCIYRRLCCCLYKRRKTRELMERRERAASSATISRLVIETSHVYRM